MAQRFFDQGLVLAYGFNHAEAVRSFQEAARIDPDCAMAYWGHALVLGPNINAPMGPEAVPEAWEALQKAIAHKSKVSQREQDLIDALATRYSEDPEADRAALDVEYMNAMRALHAKYPKDVDIAALAAESIMDTMPWAYWRRDGRPQEHTEELIEILEGVAAADPVHPGAHHYYIHVVEGSYDPYRGISSARALDGLVPGAGHLVHMPGHIFLRVGDYDRAAEVNVRAIAADDGYFTACRMQGIYPAAYYPHNIHFLWTARQFNGESKAALEAARKTASKIHEEMLDVMQQMLLTPLACMSRFGMWDAILDEPRPSEERTYLTGYWHYARGLAFNGIGRPAEARIELDALRGVISSEQLEPEQVFIHATPRFLLDLAATMLEGEIELEHGDLDRAISLYGDAVLMYDTVPYNEPEDWVYPPRHALGAALLKAGRAAEAETVYWADLARHPNNGWALTGLVQALEAQDKDASEVKALLAEAWDNADVKLKSSRY
jgi:tetratricopeptide (TPR) repeat protein